MTYRVTYVLFRKYFLFFFFSIWHSHVNISVHHTSPTHIQHSLDMDYSHRRTILGCRKYIYTKKNISAHQQVNCERIFCSILYAIMKIEEGNERKRRFHCGKRGKQSGIFFLLNKGNEEKMNRSLVDSLTKDTKQFCESFLLAL